MRKLLKWIGITIGLVLLFLFFGVNNDEVADGTETSLPPMITIKKHRYDEAEKVLHVVVSLNPDFYLKGYSFTLRYNYNYVEKPEGEWLSGTDSTPIQIDSSSFGGGQIVLKSIEERRRIFYRKFCNW